MKAFVTLDYYDGTRSKAKLMDLEGTSIQELMFRLMESGCCGFTVTKHEPMERVAQHMNKQSGRKLTTGRFDTREQLEERVRWYYRNTDMNQTEIAKNCNVSTSTVAKILTDWYKE